MIKVLYEDNHLLCIEKPCNIPTNSDDSNDDLTEKEKEYINALYYDRNIGMTEKIKEFLKDNKKVFVTVGSAHVIGNNGIIDLLGNDYTIELIK